MKIFIRGGVWSNVEDQVLIAAYMKYGNNQWTRIASLLPRKSASQVKARWEEYLDPTIRKTPWTRSEDEKLLHFARSMPMQWRTIAQYFGRSSYQCVERYRELISKATGTTHVDDNEQAVAHQMMPFFETLKATPDGIELDQDEREMLEEARARLANTQGKKARRKARQRQLDILRKTARMRKKKELDAAGLIIDEKKVWEDKEYELDPIRTHEPVKGPFDTTIDQKSLEKNRLFRIRQKQKNAQKKAKEKTPETLDSLKRELKIEEKKLEEHVDHSRKDLLISDPTISNDELKSINEILSHDEEFLYSRSSLSLLNKQKQSDHSHAFDIKNDQETYQTENYQSQAFSKGLPRPIPLGLQYLQHNDISCKTHSSLISDQSPESIADTLIRQEAFRLAFYDARIYPDTKRPPASLVYPISNNTEINYANLDRVNEEAFSEAEKLMNEEMTMYDFDSFQKAWNEIHAPDENDDISQPLQQLSKRNKAMTNKLNHISNSAIAENDINYETISHTLIEINDLIVQKQLFEKVQQFESETLKIRIKEQKDKINELEKKQKELDKQIGLKLQQKKAIERQKFIKQKK